MSYVCMHTKFHLHFIVKNTDRKLWEIDVIETIYVNRLHRGGVGDPYSLV